MCAADKNSTEKSINPHTINSSRSTYPHSFAAAAPRQQAHQAQWSSCRAHPNKQKKQSNTQNTAFIGVQQRYLFCVSLLWGKCLPIYPFYVVNQQTIHRSIGIQQRYPFCSSRVYPWNLFLVVAIIFYPLQLLVGAGERCKIVAQHLKLHSALCFNWFNLRLRIGQSEWNANTRMDNCALYWGTSRCLFLMRKWLHPFLHTLPLNHNEHTHN